MVGHDRCVAHLSLTGRKTNLTPELADQLVAMLRAGNYLRVALRAVGLDRRRYRDWMQRGRSGERRDRLYADFLGRIEKAKAEGEVRAVAQISRAAIEGNWAAAAWMLERQYPERWGRPSVRMRDEAPPPVEETPSPTDPFREVDELAERRRVRA